jgi:hypothetical protein
MATMQNYRDHLRLKRIPKKAGVSFAQEVDKFTWKVRSAAWGVVGFRGSPELISDTLCLSADRSWQIGTSVPQKPLPAFRPSDAEWTSICTSKDNECIFRLA